MAVMVVLFFIGQSVAKVAIVGGAFLLLTRRVRPEKIYIDIDWPLLVMFAGLFVVVAGFEQRAKARGIEIGFWSYFRVGAPLTVVTILIGLFWL